MKQIQLIALTVASLLTASISVSATPGERGGNRGGQGAGEHGNRGDIQAVVKRIFNHLDSDENGTISFNEFITPKLVKAEEKFAALDTDEDGLLTLAEIQAGHTPVDDPADREAIRECIADKLGIELPEIKTAEQRFDEADNNGDGFLDWDEYSAAKTAAAQEKFNHIDANSNGELDQEEVTAALKGRIAIRQARKSCLEEQGVVDDLIGD